MNIMCLMCVYITVRDFFFLLVVSPALRCWCWCCLVALQTLPHILYSSEFCMEYTCGLVGE